jgi:hypothetical protein
VVVVSDRVNQPAPRNQLWVWQQTNADALVKLAARYRVGRLLVWVSPNFTRDKATGLWLDRLALSADQRKIALDALCGDPAWATMPSIAGMWAHEVAGSGRFERIHLDIEPHALPNWSEAHADLSSGIVQAVVAAKHESAGMPVDVDIPSWYWTIPTLDPALTADRAILQVADSITLMSYQDSAAKTLAISQPEMTAAADAGKPAWIGVNVMQPSPDDPGSSMWGQAPTVIQACFGQVDQGGSRLPAFAGVAIHEAGSLSRI